MSSSKYPDPSFPPSLSDDDCKKSSKNPASSEWPDRAVAALLDVYVQKFSDGRGYLRGNDWEEVRNRVNKECEGLKKLKTIKQCRDKIDSLKRRYKMEKRRAVNGNEVTWPFFIKLDKMMASVFKQAKGLETMDRQKRSSAYYSGGDGDGDEDEDEDEEDDKEGFSGSPEEYCGMNGRYNDKPMPIRTENPKIRPDVRDTLSPEEGFGLLHSQAPLKLLSLTGAQLSNMDNSFAETRQTGHPLLGAMNKSEGWKQEPEGENSMQALADALAGFSEVYARVELAKMEIITNLKLRLARLGRKQCRKKARSRSDASTE